MRPEEIFKQFVSTSKFRELAAENGIPEIEFSGVNLNPEVHSDYPLVQALKEIALKCEFLSSNSMETSLQKILFNR